jgi:hypothetical protein
MQVVNASVVFALGEDVLALRLRFLWTDRETVRETMTVKM